MRAGNAGYEIKSPYPALFHGFIIRARPKTVIFPNLCVPAERDLRFASTGSNYNPRNTQCIPACPVGLGDRTGVVIIFTFIDLEKKDLILGLPPGWLVAGCKGWR